MQWQTLLLISIVALRFPFLKVCDHRADMMLEDAVSRVKKPCTTSRSSALALSSLILDLGIIAHSFRYHRIVDSVSAAIAIPLLSLHHPQYLSPPRAATNGRHY